LARAAKELGVQIFEKSPVEKIIVKNKNNGLLKKFITEL